jgi:hypothetical protein
VRRLRETLRSPLEPAQHQAEHRELAHCQLFSVAARGCRDQGRTESTPNQTDENEERADEAKRTSGDKEHTEGAHDQCACGHVCRM